MKPPVVPLPILNGNLPILLVVDPTDPAVELAYQRAALVGGSSENPPQHWIPRLTPVFAVSDGRVMYARRQSEGHVILIDHLDGWVSVYSRLAHMFAAPTHNTPVPVRVSAGHILGYVGTPRGTPVTPLRFELWRRTGSGSFMQVDPIPCMRQWEHIEWRDAQLARAANDARPAR